MAGSQATSAASGSKNLLIIGGVIVALAVVGVIAVVLILSNQGSTTTDLTQLNAGEPETATQILNDQLKETMVAAASGDTAAVVDSVSEFGEIQSGDFALYLDYEKDANKIDLEVTGQFKSTGDFQASATVTGTLEGISPITTPVKLEIKGVNNTAYLKLENLPAEFGMFLQMYGLAEDKWYSLPMDSSDTAAINPLDSLTSSVLPQDQIANLERDMANNPFFINSKAKESRTIDGVTLNCMTTEINPNFGGSSNVDSSDVPPIEFCTGPDSLLPIYLGLEGEKNGAKIDLGFSVTGLNTPVNITAPSGAQDLETLMQDAAGKFSNGFM